MSGLGKTLLYGCGDSMLHAGGQLMHVIGAWPPSPAYPGLSDTHVIRGTNQALSAMNDAQTIDDAAAGHNNKTAPQSVTVL